MKPRINAYSLLAVVLLLIATMTLSVVHWHNDGRDDGCQLCHVRQLPGLQGYSPVVVSIPVASGWNHESAEASPLLDTRIPILAGRAPPEPLSI